MAQTMLFGEVLEAIDKLSLEEQETLLNILHRRTAQLSRQILVAEVREARQDFSEGRCSPVSVDELMGEILS